MRSVVSPGPAHGLVDQAITGTDIWHDLAVEWFVSGTPRHRRRPSISSVRSSRNPQANRTPLVKEAVRNLMPWHGSETPGARPTCRSPVGSPAAAVFALRRLRRGNWLT